MTVMQKAARKAWKTRRANMAINGHTAKPAPVVSPLVRLLQNEEKSLAAKLAAVSNAIRLYL